VVFGRRMGGDKGVVGAAVLVKTVVPDQQAWGESRAYEIQR